MDDLTREFIAETRETLETINDALLAWEADPSATARLDEIFRFVHTVKGSCGFLDLARIEALAHAAETVLGALRSGVRSADVRLVSAMLRVIDRIALLVDALDTDAEFPPIESDHAIIAGLDAIDDSIAEPPAPAQITATRARNVRVAVDLLDTMMSEVSDLVLVRNELARTVRTARGDTPAEAALERLSTCVSDLRDSVARARMQPVERLFAALPRLVRDTAAMLGKAVDLSIEGGDVELDREMVEQLRDPLVHMVRNAIDHGIERAEDRTRASKPARALLRVSARQNGNQIAITVEDDGRGIDVERLRARAVAGGIIDSVRAAALDDDAVANLIFAAGLSTADRVTAVSGRGVGMDVVRANVERLGGTIVLDNRPGKGLIIELRAPLTLSIVTVLALHAGSHVFAMPRAAVDEVFAIGRANVRLERVGAGRIATIRDEILPVVDLGALVTGRADDPSHIIVIDSGNNQRWALAIDAIGDHQEVVVRPVAPVVSAAGLFAGQALPDDGLPLLVLDVLGLARMARIDPSAATGRSVDASADIEMTAIITFRALDGHRRAIRAGLVDRVADMPSAAFTPIGSHMIVNDGGDVYAAVCEGGIPELELLPMLRLNDGAVRIGMIVAEACDLLRIPVTAISATKGGEIALIDGIATPLIDAHALFAAAALNPAEARPTVAIMGADAQWAQSILTPLLMTAGYHVVTDEADAETILCCDSGVVDPTETRRVIHLGKTSHAGQLEALDRYDRTAILAALAQTPQRAGGKA